EPAVGVQANCLTHLPTQEVVHRTAEDLAFEVPQRDVDPADDRGGQAPRPQIGGFPKDPVPEVVNVRRVYTHDKLFETPHRVAYDEASVAWIVRRLADPAHPFVGLDPDERPRLRGRAFLPGIDDVRFQVADLHPSSSPSARLAGKVSGG